MDAQGRTIVDAWRRELAERLLTLAGHRPVPAGSIDTSSSYTSGGHAYYGLSVPVRRQLAAEWLRAHRDAPWADVLALCTSLILAHTYDEKTLGCVILKRHKAALAAVVPGMVTRWLDDLRGWAEVDSLCQNLFSAQQMLADWPAWRALILALSSDRNINKRRAALVLLTGPVHYSADARLAELALATVMELSSEREQLIAKAISWLLRSLVSNHADAVEAFVTEQSDRLPAIAVRETRIKLASGTKRGRLPV